MTWSDPIVDEVRRARDAYAARFNYDLQAIFRDLKEQEKRSGRQIVSYAEDEREDGNVAVEDVMEHVTSAFDTIITHALAWEGRLTELRGGGD